MIQRIQSVYLLITTILLVLANCFSIGTYVTDNNSFYDIYNLFITDHAGSVDYKNWALFTIILVATIVSFVTIFIYKKRMLQIRITIFNTILLICYYAVLLIFIFGMKSITPFVPSWPVVLPFISIVLNWLTIRAIGKDEMLVKAYDRLR